MTRKLTAVFATGLLGLLVTGCSSTPGVVRGQCPPGGNCQSGGSYYAGGQCYNQCNDRSCCFGNCNNGHCMNLPFHPVHRNYFNYDLPDDLCYPPDNTPAAVVQYPYYTLKGPSDFFMK